MALEKVIRPFQTREHSPPVKLQNPDAVDPQPITLRFGQGGTGKTLTGSYSSSLSVYQEKAAVESKRKSRLPSPPSSSSGNSFSGSV